MEKLLQPLFDLPPLAVYILIAILCWAEAAFFLGFFTPGELAVVTGGIMGSRGQVEVDVLIAIIVVATMLGNATGFTIGRRWGNAMLEWAPLQRFLSVPIQKAKDFMFIRGEWAIVLGRVSTPTRIVVPFLAGASNMSYRRFVMFDLPASVIWAVTWVTLGYVLGESWSLLRELSGTAAMLVLLLVLMAVLIRWLAKRIAANQRRVQALFRLSLRATGTRRLARVVAPLFRWLGDRLNPNVARGLSLTICFAALLVAIGGVGVLLSETQVTRGLAAIDFPVLEWTGNTRTEQAVDIARNGLLILDWPGIVLTVLPLLAFAFWRVGWLAMLRIAVGVIGATGGAFVLDRFVLEGHVPEAEFPSVAVASAAALMVQATALAARLRDWSGAVASAGFFSFFLCTVGLATLVAGWAAPSGIVLGAALGMAWAALLELPHTALRQDALVDRQPSAQAEAGQAGSERHVASDLNAADTAPRDS